MSRRQSPLIPFVEGVTVETRTVYKFNGRSFLTRRGAEHAAARAVVSEELGACECDEGYRCDRCSVPAHQFERLKLEAFERMRKAAIDAAEGGAT